jgi:hypothetical protein
MPWDLDLMVDEKKGRGSPQGCQWRDSVGFGDHGKVAPVVLVDREDGDSVQLEVAAEMAR